MQRCNFLKLIARLAPLVVFFHACFPFVLVVTLLIANCVHGYWLWAFLTAAICLSSSIVINAISLRWYYVDERISKIILLLHIFLAGYLHRFMQLLVIKVPKNIPFNTANEEMPMTTFYAKQNDVAMLRLFGVFLSCASLILLHSHIVVNTQQQTELTASCILLLGLSLVWVVVAYTRALRLTFQPDKTMSFPGIIMTFFWRSASVGSRLLTLLLFTSAFHEWVFLLIGIRWLAIMIWLKFLNTSFCSTSAEEVGYRMIVAYIHIFMFLNVADGETKWRASLYYALDAVEALTVFALWYYLDTQPKWTPIETSSVIFSLLVLGFIAMILYYSFFHPNGRLEFRLSDEKKSPSNVGTSSCKRDELPTAGDHLLTYKINQIQN